MNLTSVILYIYIYMYMVAHLSELFDKSFWQCTGLSFSLKCFIYFIIIYAFIQLHFSFKRHILNNHPKDILSLDEFIKLRTEVVNESGGNIEGGDEAPPGDDAPPGIETDTGDKVRNREFTLHCDKTNRCINFAQTICIDCYNKKWWMTLKKIKILKWGAEQRAQLVLKDCDRDQ